MQITHPLEWNYCALAMCILTDVSAQEALEKMELYHPDIQTGDRNQERNREIASLYRSGMKTETIAEKYGLCAKSISAIAARYGARRRKCV